MKAIKISDHVHWVGAIDWDLREFHGYATSNGTTYNAYLITGDKVVLIDTVKDGFKNEMLERIASVVDPSKIDYIVSNHAEMDHSGCLQDVIELVKPEKVFASVAGVKALNDHLHLKHELTPVKNGEILKLGSIELKFIETKMLHWPDSMFTYFPQDKVLFSQDAFGMHLAGGERFIHEIDESLWMHEAKKYYANILLPYSNFVTKLLDSWNSLNIDAKVIAPDHGPLWCNGGCRIVELYREWALQKPTKKAVIVYDTMWNSTGLMAQAIADGLIANGVDTKVMPLRSHNRSEVALEVHCAGALIVGSPTLNNGLFPTVADVLTYLKGLRPKNLIGATFGSYGWGGESVAQLNNLLTEMKVALVGEGIKVRYVPTADDFEKCFALGKQIAGKL